MQVFKGHDPYLGEDGTDVLLQVYDDGSRFAALRPGKDQTWLRWGPPVALEVAP